MTGAYSSLHFGCRFALLSVGTGLLSARSALAIVFGANMGAVSEAKIVLNYVTGGPERQLFHDFAFQRLSKLCLPPRAGIIFTKNM